MDIFTACNSKKIINQKIIIAHKNLRLKQTHAILNCMCVCGDRGREGESGKISG